MKKLFSAFIAVLLCTVMVLPGFTLEAFSASGEKADASSIAYGESAATPQADVDWDTVRQRMFDALYNDTVQAETADIKINLSGLNVVSNDANKATIRNMLQMSPRLFAGRQAYSIISSGGMIAQLVLKGNPSANLAKYNQCEEAAEALLYGIKDAPLSDVEKCLLLHDRLVVYCEYDNRNVINGTVPADSYIAYGALVTRRAVCDGYTFAYSWMLEELGIDSVYESSSALVHAWNKVYLDGVPYYVDVSWDDPVWDVTGNVSHENFMITYSTFSAIHENKTDFDHNVTSAKYENYFSKASKAQIVFIDGNFYYVKESASNSGKYAIVQRTPAGAETEKVFIDKTFIVPAGTVSYTYPTLPKILAMGSTILYTTPENVHAYDTVTGTDTVVFTPSANLFPDKYYRVLGLKQVDGTVYVTTSNQTIFNEDTFARYTETFTYCSNHDWDVIKESEGNCLDGIETVKICKVCMKYDKSVIQGEHNFEWVIDRAATCEEAGEKHQECTVCHEKKDTGTVIEAPGHSYEWITDREATCAQAGEKHQECAVCHDKIDEGTEIPVIDHNYEWVTDREATCAQAGEKHKECTMCHDKIEEGTEIPVTDHNYEWVIDSEPKCGVPGTKHQECTMCHDKIEEGTEIPALEHNYEWVIDRAATCEEAGEKHKECTICHDKAEEGTVIDALQHAYGEPSYFWSDDNKTCTATVVCANDNTHKITETVETTCVTTDPDCTNTGKDVFTADFENEEYFADQEKTADIPALGHKGEWQTVKEPTITEEGSKACVCTVCGATIETQTIPKVYTSLKINNTSHGSGTVDYKATVKFSVSKENIPADAEIQWFVNGGKAGTGDTFQVSTVTSGFSVQSKAFTGGKLINESQVETVKVNTGFFAKLIAFFRGLFGSLPTVNW